MTIRLPKHMSRVGNQYVLTYPDGRQVRLGPSLKDARDKYRVFVLLPDPFSWLSLLQQIDFSAGAESCWPWNGLVDKDGYGHIRGIRVHRLAAEYHLPGFKKEDVVRHSCDFPACCNPAHLVLGTQLENVQDRVDRDRSARGEVNGRALLTVFDVEEIRRSSEPAAGLAERFGVSKWTIYDVRRGRSWKP